MGGGYPGRRGPLNLTPAPIRLPLEVNAIVVGSPDTVIKKLGDTIHRLSPGYLILIGSDGDIPHNAVMRSIELLGKEVVPALHEIKLQPYE